MGCGGSREAGRPSPATSDATVNYDRRPKISVRIGTEAHKLDTMPQVIFIFGGPGSRKGRIVDDLVNSYGFHFLSGEEVILQDLPRKVANAMRLETIKDIKELLEADPTHVTLDWLLHMMERRIEQDGLPSATYIIDLIPNLKYLLRNPALTENVVEAMQHFEEKYPISFALNLAVPADKVLKAKQVYCATPVTGEKMKETGGQGDEADTGRTQHRAVLYEQNAHPFLDYFTAGRRLVTVDVASGVADLIWHQVHEVFCDLDFTPTRTVNTVILFVFDEVDASSIDYNKYLMKKVDLSAITDNPADSVEHLVHLLSTYIDKLSSDTDSFVVTLGGTSITKDAIHKVQKPPVIFMDANQGHLETYLPGSPANYVPKAGSQTYRSVSSVENEICLFPLDTNDETCMRIAAQVAASRTL